MIGLTGGVAHTAITALWAELYGVDHLGAIRSLAVSVSVLSSALGPLAMGIMMDAGTSIEAICVIFAAGAGFATAMVIAALRGDRRV